VLSSFTAALQFLTLLRLTKSECALSPKEFSASMVYFPVVGALQGLVLFIVYTLLGGLLTPGLLGAVLVAVLIITNGGLHLDGFVDSVDGLAGGSTPERRLDIMRDSDTAYSKIRVYLSGLYYWWRCYLSFSCSRAVDGDPCSLLF